jgi:hypothetical protein
MLEEMLALKHNLQRQIGLFANISERLQTICTLWTEEPLKWEVVLSSISGHVHEMQRLSADCVKLKQELAASLDICCSNVQFASLLCHVPQEEQEMLHDLQRQWQDGKTALAAILQRSRKLLACHAGLNRQWQEICTITTGTYDGRGRPHAGYATAAIDCRY